MLGVSQRLRQGCRGEVVDKRSAEPVGSHDKACSHILAQQRDIGRVCAVTDCQSSACVAAVGRIIKCGIAAESNIHEVERIISIEAATVPLKSAA